MKLVTFIYQDQERIGALDNAGHIVDLERAYTEYLREAEGHPHPDQRAAVVLGRDMCEFWQRGERSLNAASTDRSSSVHAVVEQFLPAGQIASLLSRRGYGSRVAKQIRDLRATRHPSRRSG